MLEVDYLYPPTHLSWIKWIFISVIVLLMYLFVQLLDQVSEKMSLLGGWKKKLYDVIHVIYILAEPLGILIIIINFILIHPILHGLLALLILVLGFTIFKSYFLGKMLLLKNECYPGQKIKFSNTEGFVKEAGKTTITLQTKQGAKHVSYVQIFNEGFTQLQGKDIGGLQTLYIDTNDGEQNTMQKIKDLLWENPYLDWSFDPEISITNTQNQFKVKILLNEREHLDDLINLISEWGYQCHLKN